MVVSPEIRQGLGYRVESAGLCRLGSGYCPITSPRYLQLLLQLCCLALKSSALLQGMGQVQSRVKTRGRISLGHSGPTPSNPTHKSLQFKEGRPLSKAFLPLVRAEKT